jgi:uncharacterized protein (DUF1800 family)
MAAHTLPPLDKVDPVKAWEPWEPEASNPWNLKWAAHLYRRAAFGASLPELREAVQRGLPATFDKLTRTDAEAVTRSDFLTLSGKLFADRNDPGALRGWWIATMVGTFQPLREKMTLFWHNHFATSIAKVQRANLMFAQNKLLRQNALGKFQPFLLDMSKDVAMLIWLDSNSNVKGKPNENYAREIMELFSLGVGNYTETDIREAARAFTGWHTEGDNFDFNKNFHDYGEKTVHGQQGNWNGDDIVRIVLEQPAASRFLVRKLYRYFISETEVPPPALLEPLAVQLRKTDYDIGALVSTMLHSRHFFSDYAYRQRIKSPVEFILGAVQSVGQRLVRPRALVSKMEAMGQQLFAPPNVKGWEGGRSWLNTATVLARHNFGQLLCSGTAQLNLADPDARVAAAVDPAAIIRQEKLTEPVEIVRYLEELVMQGDIGEDARAKLTSFLAEGKPQGDSLDQRIRATIHTLMTMPEYQLA